MFSKYRMNLSSLPDDVIGIIKEFVGSPYPFHKELLEYNFSLYELNEKSLYCWKVCFWGRDIRTEILTNTLNSFHFIHTHLLSYGRSYFSTKRLIVLFNERDKYKTDIIKTIKGFNNKKTLNRIIKEQFNNKTLSKLNHDELVIFHNWYVLHYD